MPSNQNYHLRTHPALTSFADECCATLARLIAYVGALALFGMVALHVWDQFQPEEAAGPVAKGGFVPAPHARAAFAVSAFDPPIKSDSYQVFRHPEGGRKDVFRWGTAGEKSLVELEIYRSGNEVNSSEPFTADIAGRMEPEAPQDLETAGMIDTKFGAVMLLRAQGKQDGAKSCLGFFRRFGDSAVQLSGWSCQGTTLPARRTTIACMLNRLTLLVPESEPKLADLFARAELKRSTCSAAMAAPVDWVMGAENPRLRGAL